MTTPRESFTGEEEATKGGTPARVVRMVPQLSSDLHEAMGQVMAETVRQGRRVDAFEEKIDDVLAELKRRQPELVHSVSKTSAAHTSNRMAALLGALFVLYTEAAPYLHELWKMVHR